MRLGEQSAGQGSEGCVCMQVLVCVCVGRCVRVHVYVWACGCVRVCTHVYVHVCGGFAAQFWSHVPWRVRVSVQGESAETIPGFPQYSLPSQRIHHPSVFPCPFH